MRFAPTPATSPASASQPISTGLGLRSARDAPLVVLVTLVARSCFVATRNVADLSSPLRVRSRNPGAGRHGSRLRRDVHHSPALAGAGLASVLGNTQALIATSTLCRATSETST